MERKPLIWIGKSSLVVAAITAIASFLFFYYYSDMLINSIVAAVLASGCTWLAYFILRWLLIATK